MHRLAAMTADDLAIRRAEVRDAAAVADLVRLAFATQSRVTDPPPSALKETATTIVDHLAHGGGAVAESGGTIVGAVLWNAENGGLYVGRLSVHPRHRQQGIARALIAEAECEARRLGLPCLRLGVRLALEDNRRLFRSRGFVETTFQRHDGFAEPTWVMMERRLSPR